MATLGLLLVILGHRKAEDAPWTSYVVILAQILGALTAIPVDTEFN